MVTEYVRISKTFRFEAAHQLPKVPEGHPCGRVHGHSYTVDVVLEGPIDPGQGWVLDFGTISEAWKQTGGLLDHTFLNDALPNPTAELLAIHLRDLLYRQGLPHLRRVSVHETATSSATWESGL